MFSSVRARLLALVLVASVPVAVIAGSNAVARYEQNIAEIAEIASLRREADAFRHATALDDLRQLVARLGAAHFNHLPPEECARSLRGVRTMFEDRYSEFWLLDRDGRLICNSNGTAPGTPFADSSYFRRILQTQDYALGDFMPGPVTHRLVLPAALPLRVNGQFAGVIGGAILVDWFREVAQRHAEQPRHLTWLVDAAGGVSGLDGQPQDVMPAPALAEELRASPGALTRIGASAQGAAYAYSISAPDRGMRVLVGVPAEEASREAQRMLLSRFVDLAVFLALCLFIILYGAEVSCTRPLKRLAGRVRAWTPGTAFAAPRSQWDPDEVVSLGEAVTSAAETIGRREAELTYALHQRDLLLAEIHHRVKNNLQIVASLLNMQADRIQDPGLRGEFDTARGRVQALSTLHRHLYMQGDFATVAVAPLLRELVAQFTSVPLPMPPEVTVEADPVMLPAEQATSFALLVAEVLANAVKHAFQGPEPGRIDVRLKEQDGMAELEICDNGVGLPASSASAGMGLTLIRGFAAHLGGDLDLTSGGGTRLRLAFPTCARG